MARKRRYLDDVHPRVVARSDATSTYTNNINQRLINGMPIRQSTKYYYDDLANQQNAKDKEALRRRVNARGTDTTNQERNKLQVVANKRKVMAKKYTKISGLEDRERPIPKVKQAQLYNKDKVDLAKTQQAFYKDAAANIGVDWGNSLNPYTQGDLIQNAAQSFGMSNLTPYTLPAFGSLSPNMTAIDFIKTGIGGELGGTIGSKVGSLTSDNQYAPVIGGIIGGIAGGFSGYKNLNKLNKNLSHNILSNRDVAINNIKQINKLDKGFSAYDKAKSFIDEVNKGKALHDVNEPLDWSPESWFASRPNGAKPTKTEIKKFKKHIPEYIQIQKNAGDNWLKLEDGSVWVGDPREWVMMQSKAYKNYLKESKVKIPFTHMMDNFIGTTINDKGIIGAGRLYGNGFYGYVNPNGKLLGGLNTQDFSLTAARPHGTFIANVKNPTTLTSSDITPLIFDIGKRNSVERVGSFHNSKFNGAGPYTKNDMAFMTKRGTNMGIFGYPNNEGYAYPNIKFITGNTGEFKHKTNIFRSLLPFGTLGTSLYKLNKGKNKTN